MSSPEQSTPDLQPLQGLRVLEIPHELSGSMCTMLLADLGADVMRVESPHAVEDRTGAAFVAFNRNKRSVALDIGSPDGGGSLRALVAQADAVVESYMPAEADRRGVGYKALSEINPALIYCSLSAFGQTGPLRDKVGPDLIVQALTGAMEITGEPGRPPVTMGLPVGDEIAGLLGAISILAAVERRERTQRGAHLDIASFDAGLAMLSYMANIYFATGKSSSRVGSAHPTITPYSAFRTEDSYIVAAPFTQIFWRKFCKVIDREDLPVNPMFKSFGDRVKHRSELGGIIEPILESRTLAHWLEALDKGDVPNGPVNSVAAALEMEQTKSRGMVAEIVDPAGRRMQTLGTPFHFNFQDEAEFRPRYRGVPALGHDTVDVLRSISTAVTAGPPSGRDGLPLEGIRVLDLTRMFAGPYCGQLLADLGAEVIKIEEPRIGDPTRRNIPAVNGESTYYMAVNRGKKSITLDLKHPEGRDVLLGLMKTADVLIENFRPGVMGRLGLSYKDMRAVKQDIIVLSLSGFGHTGPLRDKISFDLVNQAMAGTMAITGEPGRPPVRIGYPVGDLGGGIFGAYAVLAALHARRRTGKGSMIDLSLHDLMVSLLGADAQSFFMSGVCPQAMGSSHREIVPHRAYEANDAWLVLAARTQEAWERLATVIERKDLLADARFRSMADRIANRAALDEVLESVISRRSVSQWVQAFDAARVPCAQVLSMGEALDSAHAIARGDVMAFDHPIAGACRSVAMGINFDGKLLVAPLPPPALGQHTQEVISGLPGYTPEKIAALRAAGVIA